MLRAGTAVAANYRAACRGRSKAEFVAKLGTVVEEADETLLWCELLEEAGIVTPEEIQAITKEAKELLAIFSTARKTAKARST
ncbi:MAG: four helix bundle protein [Nitrospirota bacterium]